MKRIAHVVRMTLGSLFVTIIFAYGGGDSDAGALSSRDQRFAAGEGEDFDLSWHTIDGGGGMSSGGDFVLRGTIGQPSDTTGACIRSFCRSTWSFSIRRTSTYSASANYAPCSNQCPIAKTIRHAPSAPTTPTTTTPIKFALTPLT